MAVLVAQEVKAKNATVARIEKLAGAAFVSASLSTIIAAIFHNPISRTASHIVFIVAVAVAGFVLFWAGQAVDRFDAGLVVMLFLFEPLGRVLLHQETIPPYTLFALPLILVAAFFFGREGSSEELDQVELEQLEFEQVEFEEVDLEETK